MGVCDNSKAGETRPAGQNKTDDKGVAMKGGRKNSKVEMQSIKSGNDGGRAILKLGFAFDESGGECIAIPEFILLADRAGLAQLARLFRMLAKQAGASSGDPEFSWRLTPGLPFDRRLSDDCAIRIELLSADSNRGTLKRMNVSRASQRKGDMSVHLPGLISNAHQAMRREMGNRERQDT